MDFISNEKLLNSNEEEIKEYKRALYKELGQCGFVTFYSHNDDATKIIHQINKCNFLLTDPKAKESTTKLSEFEDAISPIVTNNNSTVTKANADDILKIFKGLNALEMIDAAGILYDGAVKKLEWIHNLVNVEPKFKDIIKKALLVKEHENIKDIVHG
jgi:hypothetical protein